MQTGDISLKDIRHQFGRSFPKSSPHHIIPSSRNGPSSHFNLFPYKRSAHGAYHELFWNMRIDEVWSGLDKIYSAIFESDEDRVYPFWLESCKLDLASEKQIAGFEREKKLRLSRSVSAMKLQELWFRAFGSTSPDQARNLLKYMMLFMVFGINMIDIESIFNNDNLIDFFEKRYPSSGDRLWAFEICFGKHGSSIHCIKSKMSKIIRRVGHNV